MSSGITFISGWGCVLFVFAGFAWQLIEAGRQIASWVIGHAKSTYTSSAHLREMWLHWKFSQLKKEFIISMVFK